MSRGEQLLVLLGPPALLGIVAALVLPALFTGDGTLATADRSDFTAFWVAGRMAIDGQGALAYDWQAFTAAMSAAMAREITAPVAWLNPPVFLPVVAALSLLPYPVAFLVWTLGTLALVAFAVRSILPRWSAVVAVAVAPASIFTLVLGQNGFVSGALLGLTLAWLDRRPVAAGIALGLMAYKPQFGLLFPVLLAATGRWRCFAAAAGTVAAASAVSLALFGPEPWRAFAQSLGGTSRQMFGADGAATFLIQSPFAALVAAGVPRQPAWAVQAAIGLALAAGVAWLWRRPGARGDARAAAALAASLLATPYVWPYDAVILGMAGVFLARAALRDGKLTAEMPLLVAANLFVAAPLFIATHLAGPIAGAIVLALALRRALSGAARPETRA